MSHASTTLRDVELRFRLFRFCSYLWTVLATVLLLSSSVQAQSFKTVPALAFTKPFGGANPLPQHLAIVSSGANFSFTATATTSTGGSWLTVTGGGCGNNCATTPRVLTAAVNANPSLVAGTYSGQIVVTTGATSMIIPVSLVVAPVDGAYLDNVPGQMTFSLQPGGINPPVQTVEVRNGGLGSLNWTVTATTAEGTSWLQVTPGNGAAPTAVNVGVVVANLPGAGAAAGTYVGHLRFSSSASSVTVPVTVTVGPSVFQQVNPISFTKPFGGIDPLPQNIVVASTGSTINFDAFEWTATGGDWLTLTGGGCGSNCADTPRVLTATVNTNPSLPAGTYTAHILVISASMSMTIPVSLTVGSLESAFLDNLPGQLSFLVKTGGGVNPAPQSIQVRNGGQGTLSWTVSASTFEGGNWLQVTPGSGTAPSNVEVSVVTANLPSAGQLAGRYTGQLRFQTPGGAVTVPVSVFVDEAVFNQVTPISFMKPFGGFDPLPQTITIASTGAPISFSAYAYTATGGDWLKVTGGGCGSNCGTTPKVLYVTANPAAGLPAGSYTGQILVTTGTMSMTIPVNLTISPTTAPFFDTLPGQLSFLMATGGVSPPSQTFQVRNGGAGSLNWSVSAHTSDRGNWIQVSPSTGTAPSTATVTINAANLPNAGKVPGTFTANLIFQSNGATASVPVNVVVGASVFRQVNPLSFTKPFSGANPLPQSVTIASSDAAIDFSAFAYTANGGNWLTVTGGGCGTNCASTPTVLTASVNPGAALAAGVYTAQILVTSGSMAMTIPVTLTIADPAGAFFDDVPGQVSFFVPAGAGNPAAQAVRIRKAGSSAGALNWTLTSTTSDGGNWLQVSAANGIAPSDVTVSVVAANLPSAGLVAGTFVGHLRFQSDTSSVTLPVSVTVGANVFTQLGPISFSKQFGAASPLPKTFEVASTGTQISFNGYEFTGKGGDWLTLTGGGCGTNCATTPKVMTATVNNDVPTNAGSYTGQIVVTTGRMALTIPVYFDIIGPQPADKLEIVSGSGQSTAINSAFASPLRVKVTRGSSPVPGVTVTFSVPSTGASATFAGGVNTAVTDAQGIATSAGLSANGTAGGPYTVTASTGSASVSLTLTNSGVEPICVTAVAPTATTVQPVVITRGTLSITPVNCPWLASSSAPWLELDSLSGSSGTLGWTAYPNFGSAARTAIVTVGGRTFTVTQTASPDVVTRRFVRLLYFSFLGRPASDADVTAQVNSGLSRAQIAMNFLNTLEFNLGGRFVAGLYVGILERDAEFGGWQFQRQALARGLVNQDQLVSNFLNSPEFGLKFGVLTNDAFVRLMYRNILLREASPDEVNAWLNVLSNPANTRTIVARTFLNSPEFRNGTGSRLLAFLIYSTLLLRDGTPPERSNLETMLRNNPSQLASVVDSFVNGPEIGDILK
jgi:hypothetical protein